MVECEDGIAGAPFGGALAPGAASQDALVGASTDNIEDNGKGSKKEQGCNESHSIVGRLENAQGRIEEASDRMERRQDREDDGLPAYVRETNAFQLLSALQATHIDILSDGRTTINKSLIQALLGTFLLVQHIYLCSFSGSAFSILIIYARRRNVNPAWQNDWL